MKRLIAGLAALLLVPFAGLAQHVAGGPVHVMSPWTRALPPVSENGAVYLTLRSHGGVPDRLTGASSPMAKRVEIHSHAMEGGMMVMRPVESVEIPPDEYVKFEPGGNHLMLIGLEQPLVEGDQFPLTLEFERGSPLEVTVTVLSVDAKGPAGSHGHGTGSEHGHMQHDQMQHGQTQHKHKSP
ncbi:MAG: copper chaperone PCu(A)C [Gammaproteobacteria bacterium]|nr:copper chaperone PCu(A)C [Gammaproteobacteria bacterium]